MLSFPENIPAITKAIIDVDPKVILDVGPGYGKYSLLAREAIYSNRAEQKDLLPTEDVVIHCCEGTEYFQNSYAHNALYSHHYHFDFFNLPIDIRNRYSLILLIDCIEHWDKKTALDQLHHTPAPMLISTPKDVTFFTDEYYHAIHGPHITQWHRQDFDEFDITDYSTPFSWIFVLKGRSVPVRSQETPEATRRFANLLGINQELQPLYHQSEQSVETRARIRQGYEVHTHPVESLTLPPLVPFSYLP